MTSPPTDDELDAWLRANGITSTEHLRERTLQTMQSLELGQITDDDAQVELQYARAALHHLRQHLSN